MEKQFELVDKLFERLRDGETLIGTHVTCNDPLLTEIIGNAGFISKCAGDSVHGGIPGRRRCVA